jgi:uncharacterized protein involved in exopolysaccharide biosynthesis
MTERSTILGPENPGDTARGEKTVQQFLDFIRLLATRWWWLFLAIGLLAGIAGLLYAWKTPVRYESRLSFALDEGGSESSGGSLTNLATQLGFNLGGSNDIFGGDNIITILKSRRMIEKTLLSVDTFNNRPQTFISYFLEIENKSGDAKVNKAEYPPFQPREAFTKLQDSVLNKIYLEFESDYITVWKPEKYLNIFEVKVISKDEKFSKEFTNQLVKETNDYYIQMRSKKGKETLNILEQRVAEIKGVLNSNLDARASVQDINVNPAFSKAQVPVMRSQTNIQAYGAAYSEMFKNLELARYQYLKQIPLMQIIDPAEYPMHKIRAGKIKFALLFSFIALLLTFIIFWLKRITRG